MSERLRVHAPGIAEARVQGATKVVGFEVGSESRAVACRPSRSGPRHVKAISSALMPLSLAPDFDAAHALSVVGFVAQLVPPQLDLRAHEELLIAAIVRTPCIAIPWAWGIQLGRVGGRGSAAPRLHSLRGSAIAGPPLLALRTLHRLDEDHRSLAAVGSVSLRTTRPWKSRSVV